MHGKMMRPKMVEESHPGTVPLSKIKKKKKKERKPPPKKTVQSCNQGAPLNMACNVGSPILCSIQPECNFITWKRNRVSKNLVRV